MDKKLFSRSSKFFKKEGFYVILFVCLCIVATVAAVTSRNSKTTKKIAQDQTVTQDSTQVALDNSLKEYENALQVKKGSSITVPKDGKSSAAVSATVDKSFIKPTEGNLAREFTLDGIMVDIDKEAVEKGFAQGTRSRFGIDITVANPDKAVVAALAGTIENIREWDSETVEITINHNNGYKTIYGNIDTKSLAEYKIAKGKQVKKGDPIGRVSKSQNNPYLKQFGTYLNFQAYQDSKEIDPAKIGIKYTKK